MTEETYTSSNPVRKDGKKKKHPTFGKIMLASLTGTLIALIIVGLFKLLFLLGVIGTMDKNSVVIKADSFLKIDLTQGVNEQSSDQLTALMSQSSEIGFNDMLRSIEAAGKDQNIKGIYLYMGSATPYSWGRAEELCQTLQRFRDNGKPVLAYGDSYSQLGYYIASIADSIYLNPAGIAEFRGIGGEYLFFKETLDRLKVKMTLVRPKSNSFKSAGETYTMNHMSDANRQQVRAYLGSLWSHVAEQMSQRRGIAVDELNQMADNLSACLATDAQQYRLVDRLCFEADIQATMKDHYGSKQLVDLAEYVKEVRSKTPKIGDKIAVIYAEGDVVEGTGYNVSVYSDKITKALNDAAQDDHVKAIVLRVNSPGGMVIASEIMTNAVARANAKKPVIVSMGDVAASAGYEISCNATTIVAEPTTLTGSIGVFATLPEVGTTLEHFLGVTTDTVKTNRNSTALSLMRPYSKETLELLQRNIEEFYLTFIGRVAQGRHMTVDAVDSIARGRVWTGIDALRLGLVDTLGGLHEAIAIAAEKAGLKNYQVVDYPKPEDIWKELLNRGKENGGTLERLRSHTQNVPVPSALTPIEGDGVWMNGNLIPAAIERICNNTGMQARVEFFLLAD